MDVTKATSVRACNKR